MGSQQKGLVSVGMATRNRAFCIRGAIEAILNQTYRNLELIISDNVSDDATQEICEEYARKDSRVRYIRQKKDVGSFANCNITIREARGEFFMRADDDDIRPPGVLEHAVTKLNRDPEIIMVFGDFYSFDPRTGRRTDYFAEKFFPFERDRYSRVRRYLSFYANDGKGLLTHGVWRRRVLGNGLPRDFYYGFDINFTLEKLIEGPFGYVREPFWEKGARIEPARHTFPPFRILRSFVNRLAKIFSRYFYINITIIIYSKQLTLWGKIRLISFQLFMMAKLFFVRRT